MTTLPATSIDDLGVLEELFHAATGKRPEDDRERWAAFKAAGSRWMADERSSLREQYLDVAYRAVTEYQPIEGRDMVDAYRRGFDQTRSGCARAILDLKL